MIIVYRDTGETRPETWEEARALFLAAIQADEPCSVWDIMGGGGYELWKFDGMARQAAMRPDLAA